MAVQAIRFYVNKGLAHLDNRLSELERRLFREFEDLLVDKGYYYMSLPSAGSWETIEKQGAIPVEHSLGINAELALFRKRRAGVLGVFCGDGNHV